VAALASALAHQPHARAVLLHDLAHGPVHAYVFYGPGGTGKRECARLFAAELLASGARDPDAARRHALVGSHPDLTWVVPTGAHAMRVEDVAEPVVAQAGQTPLLGAHRVFVIERAETMSADVANRLLKTLEEPPPYAYFVLVTDFLGRLLPTVVSRCRQVRFEPLPRPVIEERLRADGVAAEKARECAHLAFGNLERARRLASGEGEQALRLAQGLVAAWLRGDVEDAPLLDVQEHATQRAEQARSEVLARFEEIAEGSGRAKRALERQAAEVARREERRARSEALGFVLFLAAALLRDLALAAAGCGDELPLSQVAREVAQHTASGPLAFARAAERVERTRLALALNPAEDVALEALSLECARDLAAATARN
jgi:DNA polymerase-3 subunit delta'